MSDLICPHCHLPAVLPEICTPEVNEVISEQIDRDADLFNAGYAQGKRDAREAMEAQS